MQTTEDIFSTTFWEKIMLKSKQYRKHVKHCSFRLFKRENSDIRYVHKVSLRDALCGVSIKIPTLDGTTIPFKTSKVIKPNSIERISGQGLPNPKNSGRRGDLIVEFDIRFPDSLSADAKQLILNALPPN